jgi:hypothetical protein
MEGKGYAWQEFFGEDDPSFWEGYGLPCPVCGKPV